MFSTAQYTNCLIRLYKSKSQASFLPPRIVEELWFLSPASPTTLAKVDTIFIFIIFSGGGVRNEKKISPAGCRLPTPGPYYHIKWLSIIIVKKALLLVKCQCLKIYQKENRHTWTSFFKWLVVSDFRNKKSTYKT